MNHLPWQNCINFDKLQNVASAALELRTGDLSKEAAEYSSRLDKSPALDKWWNQRALDEWGPDLEKMTEKARNEGKPDERGTPERAEESTPEPSEGSDSSIWNASTIPPGEGSTRGVSEGSAHGPPEGSVHSQREGSIHSRHEGSTHGSNDGSTSGRSEDLVRISVNVRRRRDKSIVASTTMIRTDTKEMRSNEVWVDNGEVVSFESNEVRVEGEKVVSFEARTHHGNRRSRGNEAPSPSSERRTGRVPQLPQGSPTGPNPSRETGPAPGSPSKRPRSHPLEPFENLASEADDRSQARAKKRASEKGPEGSEEKATNGQLSHSGTRNILRGARSCRHPTVFTTGVG